MRRRRGSSPCRPVKTVSVLMEEFFCCRSTNWMVLEVEILTVMPSKSFFIQMGSANY
ncbi:hypothetical protein HanXRQr2_Chr03g0098371 [Helianthus annuus]|uniref:Uncharacterized protein n=1 Tax=Helianthus annuus TaxID=4232 RepID=A0A9K3NUT2_HELAN|nr:hypothetical protein HanXRQr2_Chr03g0098371 [Helianthus annuus]